MIVDGLVEDEKGVVGRCVTGWRAEDICRVPFDDGRSLLLLGNACSHGWNALFGWLVYPAG